MLYNRNHLNWLRVLAALYVVAYHMQQLVGSYAGIGLVFRDGWAGTDFFILLSGFGLDQGYRERLSAGAVSSKNFLWGRYKRIAPRYYIALALFVAVLSFSRLLGFNRHFGGDLPGLLSELLMLNGLGLDIRIGWNGPSWTVSALMVRVVVGDPAGQLLEHGSGVRLRVDGRSRASGFAQSPRPCRCAAGFRWA